jgi:hypothetical protein
MANPTASNRPHRTPLPCSLREAVLWLGFAGLCFMPRALAQTSGTTVEEEDIRPARPPVEIPRVEEFPWSTLWISMSAAALAGVLIWWLLSRRKLQRGLAPGRRALSALESVDRERTRLEPGPLADRAAGVVRQFIAEHFGIAAPARTTEEFLRALTSGASLPLAAHQELLERFLQSCDMAKFAGAEFDNAERLELLTAAINFVRAAAGPEAEGGAA